MKSGRGGNDAPALTGFSLRQDGVFPTVQPILGYMFYLLMRLWFLELYLNHISYHKDLPILHWQHLIKILHLSLDKSGAQPAR